MRNKKYIKGFLEDVVLYLIDQNGEMYGYEITKRVKEITTGNIEVTEGALYPILHKLEGENKLSVELRNADGRMRKYYSITTEGGETVANGLPQLQAFVQSLQAIFNLPGMATVPINRKV